METRGCCDSLLQQVPEGLLEKIAAATSNLAPYAYESIHMSARLLESDEQNAYVHIKWAWNDHGPCTQFWLCVLYLDNIEVRWTDGSIEILPKVQRLTTSAHDCIKNAKDAKRNGQRGLAVNWVLASQIHNPLVKEWLRQHPDAVLTALDWVS